MGSHKKEVKIKKENRYEEEERKKDKKKSKRKEVKKRYIKKEKIKEEENNYEEEHSESQDSSNNYKRDGFVVEDKEADDEESYYSNQSEQGDDNESNEESLDSSELEIIQPYSKKKKLTKRSHRLVTPTPMGEEDDDNEEFEDINNQRPKRDLSSSVPHQIFTIPNSLKEKEKEKLRKRAITKIYSSEELDSNYATEKDNKIKVDDIPERLILRYNNEEELAKLLMNIEAETDWILEKMKIQLSSIESIQNIRKKIKIVLELFLKDYYDIPSIITYKRGSYEPELTVNDIWKIYELDHEWQILCDYKKNVRMQFNAVRRVLSEKEADFIEKRHIDSARSVEELNDMDRFIHFIKNNHEDEIRNTELSIGPLRPIKKSVVCDSKKNSIDKYAKKFAMTSHDCAINLELISKDGKPHQLIPPPQPIESPPALAESYITDQYPDVLTVMTQACKYLASEMASHPFIRQYVKNYLRSNCYLSTEPTTKGRSDLDVFSSSFRTKRITKKPINLFNNDLYIDILQNEEKGLIKTTIDIFDSEEEIKEISNRLIAAYMPQSFDDFMESDNQRGWKIMREETIRILIQQVLLSQFQIEIRSELFTRAERYVINECSNSFYNLLTVGPYRKNNEALIHNESLFLDVGLPKVMSFVYDHTTRCSYCVILNEYGELIDNHSFFHLANRLFKFTKEETKLSLEEDQSKCKEMILQYRPDLIIIGANDLMSRNLKENIISCEPDLMKLDEANGYTNPSIWVTFGDLSIPQVYGNSSLSERHFPNYAIPFRQAISLGRHQQNPMEEILQLWNEDININYCLKLGLHPLQKMVNQSKLAEALEIKAIQVVNSIGVEINKVIEYPHMKSPLMFISGLGPRKAQYIIEKITQASGITMRAELLTKKIVGKKIMLNCNGFIKIKPLNASVDIKYDLLDMTRIPIEGYPLVNQLIKTALEDEVDNQGTDPVSLILRDPKKLEILDLNQYIKKQSENSNAINSLLIKCMIQLIKAEINAPFADPRKERKDLNPTELFQLIVGDESIKVGRLTTVRITRIDEQHVRCKLMNDLDGSIWIRDAFEENERGTQETIKEKCKEGMYIEARIKSINETLFKIDLTIRPSVMLNNKQFINVNELDHFELLDEDLVNQNYQQNNEDQHKYIPRTINHEKFKNITCQSCLEFLRNKEIGDCLFRPSTKGVNNLTLSWKFYKNTYSHVDIVEEEKMPGSGLGSKLKIGTEVYNTLNEIVEKYVQPCARAVREIIQSRKFAHNEQLEDFEKKLQLDKAKDQALIHYTLTILREYPLYVLLGYTPKMNSVTTEYIKIKPNGLFFHEEYFKDLDDVIMYFKREYGSIQYLDYVSKMKPPELEYRFVVDGMSGLINKKVDIGGGFLGEKRGRSPEKAEGNIWGNDNNNKESANSDWNNGGNDSWGVGGSQEKGKSKGCFNCGGEGHMSRDCPNPKKERGPMKCFNCQEEGHSSRDCPNPKKERGPLKCFNCQEEGHGSRDCPNPKKERGPLKCFNCQEDGHGSRDCPNPKKERGPMKCFNCQEEGHGSRDCPNPKKERGPMKCFNCQEEGHGSRDCPNPKKERSDGDRPMKCFNCQEEGHMSNDCPNPKKERGPLKCYNCQEEGHGSRNCPNPRKEREGGFRGGRGGGRGGRDGNSNRDSSNNPWGFSNDNNSSNNWTSSNNDSNDAWGNSNSNNNGNSNNWGSSNENKDNNGNDGIWGNSKTDTNNTSAWGS